ncbi:Low-specificity L-threonine aldolase [Vibrio parahaemolyticus]|uniref:Low-specificity L-threonine aldolase n=1 Tax=Vibrio parahaemolyticus TaxID=670 RepID=UPI0023311ADD|nr:Low-specificity L-threonine aldolase [Vibrio parahaemolyticus]
MSAAMPFDERLAQLRALFERTKQTYKIIDEFPSLAVRPTQPQANMLHLILPFSCEKLKELQHTFATEKGIWFGNPQVTAHPHQSIVEWYVGDYLLSLGDEELRSFFNQLLGGKA